jgi:hypothetical protein
MFSCSTNTAWLASILIAALIFSLSLAEVAMAQGNTTPSPAVSPTPMGNRPPPLPLMEVEQDTARYETWLRAKGKELTKPREDTSLRIGDWGFFQHGSVPGRALDRAGLDKANHAIELGEKGDWYAFLTTKGLDAAGALRRVAWLYTAAALTPESAAKMPGSAKVTAPTLTTGTDGTVTLQGWLVYPPRMSSPKRITVRATTTGASIQSESAE